MDSQFGSASATHDRSVRIPNDAQRVQTMFGPTGNGRVPEKPSAEDAGPGHSNGEHPNRRW